MDFKAMGYQAGKKAIRILREDIPIEDAKRYAIVFNIARAKELGIEIPRRSWGQRISSTRRYF